MNLSGPNVIHFGRKSQFGPDQFILVVTILFWSWPNHYGQFQINLVRPKPFWTDQNCFGHIEGQDISFPTSEIFFFGIQVFEIRNSNGNSILWVHQRIEVHHRQTQTKPPKAYFSIYPTRFCKQTCNLYWGIFYIRKCIQCCFTMVRNYFWIIILIFIHILSGQKCLERLIFGLKPW